MCVQRFYGTTLKTDTQYIDMEVATAVHSCSCYVSVRPKHDANVATQSGKRCKGLWVDICSQCQEHQHVQQTATSLYRQH